MFSLSTVAVLGLAAYSQAHMIMSKPQPYGVGLNNSPLDASGSDFPCKQRGSSTYDSTGISGGSTSMALGSAQPLSFIGGATHGGGSCQVSVTYDLTPSASSVWKVIHSIEGGCPARDQAGNIGSDANAADPDVYSFTVPTNLPTGKATIAWTWFNKVGNREMYMNCAPVTFSSTTSKRSVEIKRDTAAYNALPNMFTANIGNGCTTADSKDVLFPNPGDSVEQLGGSTASAALAKPTGTGCAAAGVAQPASVQTSAAQAAPSPAAVKPNPSQSSVAAAIPSKASLGGVFVTVAPSAVATPPSTLKHAVSTTSPQAVSAVIPVAVSPVASVLATQAAAPVATVSPSTGSTSSSSSLALTGTCATEGMWNCISGTSFQRCASGVWSVVELMAAGTSCGTSGQLTNINIVAIPYKIKPRHSFATKDHLHRHLHRHAS